MASLLDIGGNNLLNNGFDFGSVLEQSGRIKTNAQNRRQSEELQPFRVEALKQQQQQRANELRKFDEQQTFLETELVPVLQSERIFKRLSTVDDVGERRKILKKEANRAANAGNTQLAKDLFETAESTDEEIRLASTNHGDVKSALLAEGTANGIPGLDILAGTGRAKFQKTPGVIVEKDGKQFIQKEVFDPNSGGFVTDLTPVQGELVSKLGETPAETQARLIDTAGGKKAAELESIIEKTPELEDVKLSSRERAKRTQLVINEGRAAAKGLPILNRTIALLDVVKTGGAGRKAILAGKNFLGLSGADETELSTNLGRNVLSQLKSIFGSAFTEKEGDRLEKIEANFGKSTEGNRRLLEQTRKLVLDASQKAIKRAIKAKDFETAQEIQGFIDFDLSKPLPSQVKTATTDPGGFSTTSTGVKFRKVR